MADSPVHGAGYGLAPSSTAQSGRESAWRRYVEGCANRDQTALAALYDESSSLVYSIALRVLQNPDDAAEVVVDVYRQIWESAGRFDEGRGSAAAWIVTLARSRAMDRRRAQTTRMRVEVHVGELPVVVSQAPSPEGLLVSGETGRKLTLGLAALPVEQRQAIELAYYSGLSHAEIASQLGEPLGTIKTRIRLGVGKLRELMRGTI